MSDEAESVPRYLGELGNLDEKDRLIVPVDLRHAIPWLGGTKPVRLIAELREKGRIRLHPLDEVSDRLESLRRRILDGHPRQSDALAALADRFRPVSYYPSDTRVHLSPAIAMYLKCESSSLQTYYVEGRVGHIDVMTLAIREERLKAMTDDIELPEA